MMLALAAMVVSCSKGGSSSSSDSVEPTLPPYSYEASDTPINFDGYEQTASTTTDSRAYIREGSFVNGDSFGVHAYLDYTDVANQEAGIDHSYQSYMDNIRVLLDDPYSTASTNWVYTPTKYWPYDTNIKIKFFAYYPHSNVNSNIITVSEYAPATSIYPSIKYTPNTNAAYQYDFMTAVTKQLYKDHVDLYTYDVYTGVPFSFEHQLAKVKFSANHNSSTATDHVMITKVVYKGTKLREAGTFTESETDGEEVFEWGNLGTTTVDYTLNSGLLSIEKNSDEGYDADLPLYTDTDTEYKNISNEAGEGVFLLHPQDIAANGVTFVVTFKVIRDNIEIITANQTFQVTKAHELKKGETVNYQFTINVKDVSSIVTANVVYEDWVDYGSFGGDDGFLIK